MDKYFDYEDAVEYMRKGAVTSNGNGEYDYYKIENDTLYGYYSCDDDLFEVDLSELKRIKNSKWYLIEHAFDIHIVENVPSVALSFAYPFSEETDVFSQKVAKICGLDSVFEEYLHKPFTQESIEKLRFDIKNRLMCVTNDYGIIDYKQFLKHLYNESPKITVKLDID